MNFSNQDSQPLATTENEVYSHLPESFAETVKIVEAFALKETQESAQQKQLYYHTCEHVQGVKQRAERIFRAIIPFCQDNINFDPASATLTRMKHLIGISALAHDMVQEFLPEVQPYSPRRRETGVSEAATSSKLIDFIENINQQIIQKNPDSNAVFKAADIQIIKEAIEATVCQYDTQDNSIYQSLLYEQDKSISLPAKIVALADIGALGMDGIEAYKEEGTLIFLEENPDVIPLLWNDKTQKVEASPGEDQNQQELYEGIRQRLLRRANFQINFAKGRVSRFDREVAGLPDAAIQILKTDVFKYLTPETLQEIETSTPTEQDTSLQELIDFFELEKYISLIKTA